VNRHRILPCGAELVAHDRTRFRLWAPDAQHVSVVLEPAGADATPPSDLPLSVDLHRDRLGWHEGEVGCGAGVLYRYRIDDELDVPDPASRFNPSGVSGPSEVIDPDAFQWNDTDWRGRPWHEAVLYELHVGTFTREGTFAAIVPRLQSLVDTGITCIELLPVATFPGRRGWGYDGVLPFAPHFAYGRPDDLKRLVQAAHSAGLSIILDVVYNHFGPEGNYLHRYAKEFFTDRHHTPWGSAINFEGEAGRNVRDFFIENALYWIDEYRFDGLRLDAIHAIKDDSPVHVVDELAVVLENGPARERHIHLVLENHFNEARRLERSAAPVKSHFSKAQWNDDFHHAFHVLVTGEDDGYYIDYTNPLARAGRILAEGFAYQGEQSAFGKHPRGEPSVTLAPTAFISFLQNHDQIGNRAMGERIGQLADPQKLRAAMAMMLLSPQVPMLFMGEEYAAAEPFLYFCDYRGELAAAITKGRRSEFGQFRGFDSPQAQAGIPDPNAQTTFTRSQLDWELRNTSPHRDWLQFTRELLQLRRENVVPLIPLIVPGRGAFCIEDDVLTVRWPLDDGRTLALRTSFNSARTIAPVERGLLYSADPPHSSRVRLWVS